MTISRAPLARYGKGWLGSTAIGVLNLAADSLARWFCGPATPTAGAAGLADLKGFVWHDTSTNTLKVRDQADANWIVVGIRLVRRDPTCCWRALQ